MLTAGVIGAVIAAALAWNLTKRLASDRIQRLMDRRRSSSRLVSRGEYLDGGRHVPVSLALSGSAFYYESAGSKESLNLEWVEEVTYGHDPVSGHFIGEARLLRLLCFDQPYEFLISVDVIRFWQAMLPAHSKATPQKRVAELAPA